MLVPILLFLTTGVRWASAAHQATPSGEKTFETARAAGQKFMIPICEAHFCAGNATASKGRICSCEEDCLKRRDCCLDALTNDHVREHMDDDLVSCVPTPRGHGPFLLVSRCPSNWTNEVVRLACEGRANMSVDPNRALPVVSTRTNHTYKNIYCGQCNEGDIKPGQFHLKFKCEEGNVSSVQEALKDSRCDAFVDSSVGYCEMMDKTVTTCPDTWKHENEMYTKEIRWRCDVHFGPLTVQEQRYKNIFCAVCNGAIIKVPDITCRNSYYPIEKEFVLTLDGEFSTGSLIPSSGGKVCNPGEVYDPFRKQCRRVVCENEADCNETSTAEWSDIALVHSASPCNMTLIGAKGYDIDNATVTLKNSSIAYRQGEYELISVVNDTDSVLVCLKSTEKSTSLFPQHFCERRNLLGYGSCGCQGNCVQSRSCCLDAFDDTTVDSFRKLEPWTCLNDSSRSSAIAKCPTSFKDATIRDQCVDPPPISQDAFAHVPVFAWEHSALYRNVFCAVCNGATNVTFHKLHFLCAEHASMRNGWEAAEQFVAKPDLCELQVELPDQDLPVKPCVMDPHCRQCPETWGHNGDPFHVGVRWRCEHYYAPVAIDGVCYRNDFCAVCNGVEPTDSKRQRFFSDHLLKPVRYSGLLEKGIFTTFTVG